jgi:uncharacterized protein YkwD
MRPVGLPRARRRRASAGLAAAWCVARNAFALGAEPVPDVPWASSSSSPSPLEGPASDPIERDALQRCGPGDARLQEVARRIADLRAHRGAMPSLDAISAIQRAAGEPHPWPSVWSALGRTLESPSTMGKLDAWLASVAGRAGASRRCGVAVSSPAQGERALVVVAVDALADQGPLPVRARTGQWLTVTAVLRVPARSASLVVLGPSGVPRAIPSSFDGRSLKARFAPDSPGPFSVQVVADVGGGPRPVLESCVFADVPPSVAVFAAPAPGEEIAAASPADDDALAAMTAAARVEAGAGRLVRDPRLDAVARDHASRMAFARSLAHDAGDGGPADRLRAAGVDASLLGENVASAPTVALAHRALWHSPSHRANLVRDDFDRIGVGAARDVDGMVWVAEEFTGD